MTRLLFVRSPLNVTEKKTNCLRLNFLNGNIPGGVLHKKMKILRNTGDGHHWNNLQRQRLAWNVLEQTNVQMFVKHFLALTSIALKMFISLLNLPHQSWYYV